ncbi:MAG: hypothetical protein ACJ70U_00025 [Nitrososphaera sp.]
MSNREILLDTKKQHNQQGQINRCGVYDKQTKFERISEHPLICWNSI